MKRFRLNWMICLLLVMTLLFGCAAPGIDPTTASSTVETTQAPTEPHTEPPTELPTEPPIEPVKRITCVAPELQPTILPADDGCAILSWINYEATACNISLIDPITDTVKRAVKLDGWWSMRGGRFSDGSFSMYDEDHQSFLFLNENLEEVGRFTPEDPFGIFSHDRKHYYFVKDRVLYCTNLGTGDTARIDCPYNLRISNLLGMHPTKNQLAFHFIISPFNSRSGTAIFDLDSGEFLMLNEEIYQIDFRPDSVCLMHFDNEEMAYNYTYGSEDTGFYFATPGMFKIGCELEPVDGTDYLMGIGEPTILYHLAEQITAFDLSELGIIGELRNACYLPDSGTIIGGVYADGGKDNCQIYVIAPDVLDFEPVAQMETVESPLTVDPELGSAYWGALSGGELPEDMDGVRAYADSLEERYGVTILLSSQCAEACVGSFYEMTTTDQMDFYDEPFTISQFLNALDQCLAIYPEGFFRQFENGIGDGGIRILPVGHIQSDYNYVGLCFEVMEWNNIAVDVTTDSLVSVISHEIWHATENKIEYSNFLAFSWDEWVKRNPPDFLYSGEAGMTGLDQSRWTLYSPYADDEVFFIDSYGRVNPMEDRARIMEYAMTREDMAQEFMASPALMAKLKKMCEAVRSAFDTTGWENVRWERFFED